MFTLAALKSEEDSRFAWPAQAASRAVTGALAEDCTAADLTTQWTVPAGLRARGYVEAREAGTIAGLPVFAEVYRQLDAQVRVRALVADGERVTRGRRVVEISGPARSILTGERVALNFLQRLSGIATTAASYVACVEDLPVSILDTQIEVEVSTVEQARQALECEVDWILLDNMTVGQLEAVVRLRDAVPAYAGIQLEASGNVTLESVRSIALTGVDAISVGALTHSARALDLSLLIESAAEHRAGR
ncbi:MAG TPA: hypothetical protein VFH38_08110 [Jatrophihabitans sp.]|nr:hypothetical protein [Jatrophihabitans sp.]